MERRVGFGGVSLGFATDAPCGRSGSFTEEVGTECGRGVDGKGNRTSREKEEERYLRVLKCNFCASRQRRAGMRRSFEPGLGGVVSLEPQPFLHGGKAAPKSQWVTVKALW